MKFSGLFFLVLMVLVPTLAHADIFAQLSQNALGGCKTGLTSGFAMECSKDYKDGLFSAISCKVLTAFNKGVVPMYCHIVTSPEYISAIHAAMALFIIIWGITFIIGNVPTTTGSAMTNLLKVSFVYFFCTNTDVFFNFLYPSVLSAPSELVRLILGSAGGSKDFYTYVDTQFTEIFKNMFYPELQDGSTAKKLDVRLFVLGIAVGKLVPGGAFITGLFFMVISGWMMSYINIMVRYLVSILGLIFLLMLTPIFLPAKLFKAMEFLTDEWIKMITSFIIQIVVVVTFLIMIEPFFTDFMELVKLGFNKIVLENGTVDQLVGQGKTIDGTGVEAVYQKTGPTMATSEAYVLDVMKLPDYGGPKDPDEFVPWFVYMLLQASVVIYLTYQFMREVPKFASIIAGNPKFVSLFQTQFDSSFGTVQKPIGMPHEEGMGKVLNAAKEGFTGEHKAPPAPPTQSAASGRAQAEAEAGIDSEEKK